MWKINYIEIGERIREARKGKGLTQEEASERCNITSSFYGNIERGSRKMSIETLCKIAEGLEVSTDRLLFGSDVNRQDFIVELLAEVQRKSNEKQFEKYLTIIKSISSIIDEL